MNRKVALQVVLALVGLLFLALAYPLIVFARQEPSLSMMFSLYVTLGVFLLLAIRNPLASRSLISFAAWSSFAHAAVMGTQALRNMVSSGELIGVAVLILIGIALIALAPQKQRAAPALQSRAINPVDGKSARRRSDWFPGGHRRSLLPYCIDATPKSPAGAQYSN